MNIIEAIKLLKEGKAKYFGIDEEYFKNIRMGIKPMHQDKFNYTQIMAYEVDDTGSVIDDWEATLTVEEILRDNYVILE